MARGSFALDLQKFVEKVGKRADDLVGTLVVRIGGELDRRSPVGDATYWKNPAPKGYVGGRFRGNWQLGIDRIPQGETGNIDMTGAETQGRIVAAIPEKASGKVFYLVNNSPYGPRIERGWSRQAPQGLVALTAIQFQQIVDETVGKLAA